MERLLDKRFHKLNRLVNNIHNETQNDLQKLQLCLNTDIAHMDMNGLATQLNSAWAMPDTKRIRKNKQSPVYMTPDISRYSIEVFGRNSLQLILPPANSVPFGHFMSVVLSGDGRKNQVYFYVVGETDQLLYDSSTESVPVPFYCLELPVEHIILYSDGHSKWKVRDSDLWSGWLSPTQSDDNNPLLL
jgi:hypothetical protein